MTLKYKPITAKTKVSFLPLLLLFFMNTPMANTPMADVNNPYAGNKTAFMHDDALSSDAFHGQAPTGDVSFLFAAKSGTVPTILQGSDDLLQVICVRNESTDGSIKRSPYLLLLNPETMATMASFKLPDGRALNNIYGYLNENDELLLANGKTIFNITHSQTENGWQFQGKITKALALQGLAIGKHYFDQPFFAFV